MKNSSFQSFLMGGFECSTHRISTGKRVDVIASSKHDVFAESDYRLLLGQGIKTARDGIRWHLIEKVPYEYDFSSVINQVRAARLNKIQIIWDLFHYGYPDNLDIFSPEFIDRFAAFTKAFTQFLFNLGETQPLVCLANEISFFSWAAAEVGIFYPFERDRGDELKRQLVRASITAAESIKQIAPNAVLIQTDPAIRVSAKDTENAIAARNYHDSQFHALDLLLGKSDPELGGKSSFVDIIGVNYYPYNQWLHPSGERIMRGHNDYQPFSEILREFFMRFQKPLFVAETGVEDDERAAWFRYICDEVRLAEQWGVPILGICLYPVMNHPGWDDDRHCHNGLWDYADETGTRNIYAPLAAEVKREIFLRETAIR